MATNKRLFISNKQLSATAKALADEVTRHNAIEKNLNTVAQILREDAENKKVVKEILLQRAASTFC